MTCYTLIMSLFSISQFCLTISSHFQVGSLNLKLFDSLLIKPCELTVMELFARYLIPRGYIDSSKLPSPSTNNSTGETTTNHEDERMTPTPPATPMSPGEGYK